MKPPKPTSTHIELEFEDPIIWPQAALEILEAKMKDEVKTQLDGHPEARLNHLVNDALDNLFIGLRGLDSREKEVVVLRQTVTLSVWVVETRKGHQVRRRRLNHVKPIEIVWTD